MIEMNTYESWFTHKSQDACIIDRVIDRATQQSLLYILF